MKLASVFCCAVLLAFAADAAASAACPKLWIKTKPASLTLSDAAPISVSCSRLVPTEYWQRLDFTIANPSERRMAAVKLQIDLLDAFGAVLQTWPIVENAHLGQNDTDNAEWGVVATDPAAQQADRVEIYVAAVKYEDGTTWVNPNKAPAAGPTPPPESKLQRASSNS